jgi:hypothetical protein
VITVPEAAPAVAEAVPRAAPRAEQPIARIASREPTDTSVREHSAEPKPSPQELQRAVQAAFVGEIPPVKVPFSYRCGILLVSVVMVLLPLIYVALIALCCYGVYYHMTNHYQMVGAVEGRGAVFALLAYLAPLIIGCISILFMVKPLFARSSRDRRTRSVTRDGEPVLFDFVDRLCEVVRAPRPRRIDVDCEVNASASFRRGIWSMIVGNDLVLTIGMPLVTGLTARQMAGVLAHEFGHFSQGAGMRLSYVVRSISHWFTRVVYERDSWDQWLSSSTEGLDLRIAWVLYLAKLFVWLTRKVLWVLMMIGHSVAGYLLRQMEFDADRYEARLAGSQTFESTCRRLHELMAAYEKSQSDLGRFYREGRLGDNLPKLIHVNVEQIPDDLKQHLNKSIDESRTGLFDTHPADRDRIASARRENSPGIFQIERPASDLFLHYDELCVGVTWDFYRGIFGPKFQPSEMHPVDDLLERQEKTKGEYEALDRYSAGAFNILRPLRLPTVHLDRPGSAKQTAEALKEARRQMLAAKSQYDEAFASYDRADTHTIQATGALAMYRARLSVRPEGFEIPVDSRDHVRRVMDNATTEMLREGTDMEPYEDAFGQRLVSALQLLYVRQVAERIEESEAWREEASRLLPLLQSLSRLLPKAAQIRNNKTALDVLFSNLEGNESNQSFIEAATQYTRCVREELSGILAGIGSTPYPFDHVQADMSVGRFLMPDGPPAEGDIGAVYEAADHFLDRIADLYPRVASRLAQMAERVEKVLGLPPLKAED